MRHAAVIPGAIMKRSVYICFAATLLLASTISAQYGRGGGLQPAGRYGPSAPKLPGVELAGPLDSALARVLLSLTPEQATRYAQTYDSFMVATRPERDSAGAALAKMNERLDTGDRAAAMFYAERAQEFGKVLKDRQERFESDLRRWLSGDQVKAYKKWRDGEDQAADRRRREDEVRWQEAGFRGDFGSRGSRRRHSAHQQCASGARCTSPGSSASTAAARSPAPISAHRPSGHSRTSARYCRRPAPPPATSRRSRSTWSITVRPIWQPFATLERPTSAPMPRSPPCLACNR